MNFTFDKNAVIAACSGRSPNDDTDDFSCIEILIAAPRRGHIIVVTKEIELGYFRIFDNFRSQAQGPDTLTARKAYIYAKESGRVDDSRVSDELPAIPDESRIKNEDIPFARLAVFGRSLLVTYDNPLLEVLKMHAASPISALRILTS